MVCPAAIAALATLKTERAAEAVASQMPRYRGEAGKALKDMGPIAEAATIALLKNTDFWMRRETVGVLAAIGGEDAVQALQELVTGLSDYDSGDMRQAINTIQCRLASQPKGAHATPRHAAQKPAENRAQKPAETPAAADQEMRTWHDASGKFEIEATLVSVKDQTVTLKKKRRSHDPRVAEKAQCRRPEIRPGTIAGRLRRGRDRRIGLGGAVTRRAGTSGQRMPRRRRVRWRPREPPAGRR